MLIQNSSQEGIENATYMCSYLNTLNQAHITEEQYLLQSMNEQKAKRLFPAIFITIVLMVIGLLGNPLSIYIYGWRWRSSSTRSFLLCLAAIDLMNCLITMPTEIIIMRNSFLFDNDVLCKVSRFTTYVMNNATSAILLAIAVDRYIRICRPHQTPISQSQAKIACAIGLIIGIAVSWPALVLYGRITLPVPVCVQGSPPREIKSIMCLVHVHMTYYNLGFVSYLTSAFFVCVLILVVLYTLIGQTILKRKQIQRSRKEATVAALENFGGLLERKHESNVAELSSSQPPLTSCQGATTTQETSTGCNLNNFSLKGKHFRPHRATLMLFLITLVFIISFLPFLIITIIRQNRGSEFYASLTPAEDILVNIFLRSYLVNNCANPIVYGFCNSLFRSECKRIFRRICLRSNRSGEMSGQDS